MKGDVFINDFFYIYGKPVTDKMLIEGFKKKLSESPESIRKKLTIEQEIMGAQPWENDQKSARSYAESNDAPVRYAKKVSGNLTEANWYRPENASSVFGWVDKLVNKYPESPTPLMRKSQLLVDRGEFSEAIACLVDAMKIDKFNPRLPWMISINYMLSGDYENALDYGSLYTRMMAAMVKLKNSGYAAENEIYYL